MDSTATRLEQLRADIEAGTYAPSSEAVAESLVAWIAVPEQFEQAGHRSGSARDGVRPTVPDQEAPR